MKTTKPLGNALRLEVESEPEPGALVNLVKNPNGDLGGWGWVTPVAGSTMKSTLLGSTSALQYSAPAGASYFTSENLPVKAGDYAAASINLPGAYPAVVLQDSPLGYWRHDEAAGAATMLDSSGNARNGTYTVGASITTGTAGIVPATPTSTAANLIGAPTTPAIGVLSATWMNTPEMTAETWIRPGVGQSNRGIFSRFNANTDWIVWIDTGNKIAARFYNEAGASVDLVGPTVQINGTQHVVATYKSGDARLYVNGAQVAQSSALTGAIKTAAAQLLIGSYSSGPSVMSLQGVVDESAFYGKALTPERVAAHYAAGAAIPPAHRMRFEWLKLDGTSNGVSTQAAYYGTQLGPLQIPASTSYARLRVDLYRDAAGNTPLSPHTLTFNQATVATAATSAALGTYRENLVGNPSFESDLTGWAVNSGTISLSRSTTKGQSGTASAALTNTNKSVRTNLITNPSFEVNMTGWTGIGSGNPVGTRTTAASYVGVASAQMLVASAQVILSGEMPVVAGQSYTLSARMRCVSGSSNIGGLSIDWRKADHTQIYGNPVENLALTSAFTLQSLTRTAPAGAAYAVVEVWCGNANIYVDAVMFEKSAAVGPYFDGSTAPAGNTTYAWTGTAHASASEERVAQPSSGNLAIEYAKIPVTELLDYTVSAYIDAPAATISNHLWYRWWKDSTILVDYFYQSTSRGGAGWQRVSKTLSAPSTATHLQIAVGVSSLGIGEVANVDAVMVEQSKTLGSYIEGVITTSNLGYVAPVQSVNVLGPAHELTVTRAALNVGTLSAVIVDAELDPSQSTVIRPGHIVRLLAYSEKSATWQPVFTGTTSAAKVEYELTEPNAAKRARIELTAVDAANTLANTKRADGVATIAELPAVLEGCGVPWNVNGSGNQVPAAPVVAVNESASALDQVAVTRDSVLGYAWMDRFGVLQAWDRDLHEDFFVTGDALTEDVYSDVVVGYNTEELINEVSIKFLRLNPDDNSTEEIAYGPYRDTASIAEWDVSGAEFTVQGIAEETADLAAYAQAILDANATPAVRLNTMSVTVDLTDDWAAVATSSWYAFVDLYDHVEIQCARANITSQISHVKGIKHSISGPESRWTVELDFSTGEVVASPTFVPSPTTGPGGKTIGQLLRPVGEVTMWYGAKTAVPGGWLVCDGSTIPAEYTELIALVGSTTPNFTDKFPIGAGTKALGTFGGDSTAVIGPEHIPTHTHGLNAHTHTQAHTHNLAVQWIADTTATATSRRITDINNVTGGGGTAADAVTKGVNTASTGGPSPTATAAAGYASPSRFDVLNPWRSLWFIIRAR